MKRFLFLFTMLLLAFGDTAYYAVSAETLLSSTPTSVGDDNAYPALINKTAPYPAYYEEEVIRRGHIEQKCLAILLSTTKCN